MRVKIVRYGARGLTILLLGAGAVGAMATAAHAASFGNTVLGCRGEYFDRAWNQQCPGGAEEDGLYTSTADCTLQTDHVLNVTRPVGNTQTFNGPDCTFEVNGVNTIFQG